MSNPQPLPPYPDPLVPWKITTEDRFILASLWIEPGAENDEDVIRRYEEDHSRGDEKAGQAEETEDGA